MPGRSRGMTGKGRAGRKSGRAGREKTDKSLGFPNFLSKLHRKCVENNGSHRIQSAAGAAVPGPVGPGRFCVRVTGRVPETMIDILGLVRGDRPLLLGTVSLTI